MRPDYPSSGFVLVFWGFRADRVARSNSDFATSLRAKMGRFFGPSKWIGEEIRKFRLKRSVFCLFGLSGPQIGNQIVDMFLYTFGVGASSVRMVLGHLTKPLVL